MSKNRNSSVTQTEIPPLNAVTLSESQRLSFSLQDWLDWQLSLHTQEIDLGLTRITQVAQTLGLQTDTVKQHQSNNTIITIAGTNGKGSCVATLEALLLAQSASVGAYTSPHLLQYNERIRVNGQPVSDALICEAFAAIDRARGDISLTFFEFGTLAALYVFNTQSVDFWLLEVGLGGRLDAVNIMDADVSVVTSIDIDHVDWLGDDRSVIGREKAGVFRSGRPAICADITAPDSVFTTAETVGAHWQGVGQAFSFTTDKTSGRWRWHNSLNNRTVDLAAAPSLPEPSVAAALMVLQNLNCLPDNALIESELSQLSLAGRNQILSWRSAAYSSASIRLRLDVAHNPAASELLSQRLSNDHQHRPRWALLAMMADKDIEASIKPLLPHIDYWICVGLNDQTRALTAADMKQQLLSMGVEVSSVTESASIQTALDSVGQASVPREKLGFELLVTGSFFTVAGVLEAIQPL